MIESIAPLKPAFDASSFVDSIAKMSRDDGEIPDPEKGIGRKCYAFSEQEDRVHIEAENAARDILSSLEEGKDFEIRHDAIGNTFITLKAHGANMLPLWIGSHLDSVQNGGKYDGVVGVSMGFDILSTLVRDKVKTKRDFTVAVFRSEESSPKNGHGCLGSTIGNGLITPEELNKIVYDKSEGVTFREHFISRYGEDRWRAVEASLGSAPYTKDTVQFYVEPHIEQSSVIEANKADIGIVVDGIGGARRERTAAELIPETIDTSRESYDKLTLTFEGAPDHTGGTPPNKNFYSLPGVVWYRKDALVASSNAVNKLLADSNIKLLSSSPPASTGFTSIPAKQIVQLLLPQLKASEISSKLAELVHESSEKLGVSMTISSERYAPHDASVVASARVRQLMNIPQVVSSLASKAFHAQGTETGTTRATVVDFYLSPDKLAYNLDLREVNEVDLKELLELIHARQELSVGSGATTLISAKVHSPVDTDVARRLQEHARELGITFVLMPSMPGHDADRMAARGVPVGMIFIRQKDGVSHSPYERMDWDDYKKAAAVAKTFFTKALTEE